MPRRVWVLAMSAAAALAPSLCPAAETSTTKPAGRIAATPSADVPTKYSRTQPAQAGAGTSSTSSSKYSELFGEAPKATPVKDSKVTGASAKSAAPDKTGAMRAGGERTAAWSSETDNDAPLGTAAFKKAEGNNSFIQPVRHTEERAASSTPKANSTSRVDLAPQIPSLNVEWVRRSDINVGQECTVDLIVRNTGTTTASKVSVDGFFPTTVRLTSAVPKPATITDHLTWNIEAIPAGSEYKVTIKMIPSRRGELATNATVRLTGSASAAFRVEEPLLKVALKGPSDIMVGDPASQTVVISNPGSGIAHDVKLDVTLSEGLECSKGSQFVMDVGSINAGESQTIRLPVAAVKGGRQTVTVVATSTSDAGHTASSVINVLAPALQVAIEGPGLRYKGRNAKYVVTVKNDGSVPTTNVRVTQNVAEGFEFVSADKGGKFDSSRNQVSWLVSRIEPNQSVNLICELTANALGSFAITAQAANDTASMVEASTTTNVEGSSALSMKVIDLDDPVEVGGETAYEIRVSNEGTKAATGVTVTCDLPAGLELINARGATEGISDGRIVGFKPLASLAPGTEAIFRVHVRSTQEGNLRFRARVTSNSIEEPLLIEEQTKFYSDVRR
ncbi:conserved repeat domain protein [Planctopirus limnophila DSM 3776]|uniref:Conserved repeat domain protein n=1 Tax=Planctopirus limnophila (strain ATCC 43296 / DSM 3776 / IFAM 1008 / Mu 290) TaxID=521674 RepID=D5SUJ3_PLAL2|nr:DUF11 domain-containing protein [Planctopirus limnophila]ADG67045.1 conserved repeat domain protein [Planctopirus limnophila DSM 3776]